MAGKYLLPLLLLLLLASCAPPLQNGEDGNITILLSGGSGARYAISGEERDNNLVYIMDFSSSLGESRRVETSPGEANVTLFLTLGSWTVRAEAFHNGELFGTGEARFTVRGGRNDPVIISMSPLSGNGFLSDSDTKDFGPDPAVDKMFKVDSPDKWNAAVADIQDGGPDKNYVITLTGDITIFGSPGATFGSASGITISLRGAHTISLEWDGTNGHLLFLGPDQTLILRDLTLKGHTTNTAPLVYISSGSAFRMKAGAKITGNTRSGVFVYGGSFTMEDGEISGNNGGVEVVSGSFIMTGGKISGNSAGNVGGGVHVEAGSFKKTGGTIYGSDAIDASLKNTTTQGDTKGHAVYVDSGGKYRDVTAGPGDDIDTTDYGTGLFAAMTGIEEEDFGDFALIPKEIPVNDEGDWNAARAAISGGNGKNYIITLGADLTLDGLPASEGSFGSASGIKVSLRGAHTLTLDPGGTTGRLLQVRANQTLILRDLTLIGRYDNNAPLVLVTGASASLSTKAATIKDNLNTGASSGGGVFVSDGAGFTMEAGEISGNTAMDGGGVYVTGNGSSFTMKDGKITNNYTSGSGGGVYVIGNGASFTMADGEISGNTASDGKGGGVSVNNSGASFTMEAGTISDNTASGSGGGIYVGGGAVNNIGSSFTMKGGEISGNTGSEGGGVFAGGAGHSFTMVDGEIFDNNATGSGIGGGGVAIGGSFIMKGGKIFENEALFPNKGGGVSVDGGGSSFAMEGGEISGNTGSEGGGVSFLGNSFTMSAGAKISGNTANNGGGGVFVSGGIEGSGFTMTGGEISGNTGPEGGGVQVGSPGKFFMEGGKISDNTTTIYGSGLGGGVLVRGDLFRKTGDSIIYGDMNNTHTPEANENTATSGIGHSVYYEDGSDVYYCNDTLDSGQDISTEDTPLPANSGDIEGNWTKQ